MRKCDPYDKALVEALGLSQGDLDRDAVDRALGWRNDDDATHLLSVFCEDDDGSPFVQARPPDLTSLHD